MVHYNMKCSCSWLQIIDHKAIHNIYFAIIPKLHIRVIDTPHIIPNNQTKITALVDSWLLLSGE